MVKVKVISLSILLFLFTPFFCFTYELEDELESKIEVLEKIIDSETGHIDNLQQKFFSLQKEKQTLTAKITSLENKIKQQKELIKELKSDLKRKPKKEVVYKASPGQEREIKGLQEQLSSANNGYAAEKKALQDNLDKALSRARDLEQKLADKKTAQDAGKADSSARLEKAARDLETSRREQEYLKSKLQNREKEIVNLKKRLEEKSDSLRKLEDEAGSTSGRDKYRQDKISGMEDEIRNLEAQKKELGLKLDKARSRARDLEKQAGALGDRDESTALAKRLKEKESEIDKLEQALAVKGKKVSKLAADNKRLSAEQAELYTKLSESEKASGSYEREAARIKSGYEKELERLGHELERKDAQVSQLKASSSGSDKYKDTARENKRLVKEIIAKDKEISSLQKSIIYVVKSIDGVMPSSAAAGLDNNKRLAGVQKKRIDALIKELRRREADIAGLEKQLSRKHTKDERYMRGKKELLADIDAKDKEIEKLKGIIKNAIVRIEALSSSQVPVE